MARNINDRLINLNNRRKGIDRLDRVGMESAAAIVNDSVIVEKWEKRATAQPFTRYALGAMQAVEKRYTDISIETAIRVGKQLEQGLSMNVDFRLQGSVPLDVHIRGVSDVDLLTLAGSYLTYTPGGALARAGRYTPTNRSAVDVLVEIREEAESVLKAAYPAVTVDCSGGKAIAMSGGSLARPVDVVPSHWHDNVEYQAAQREYERGVTILDKHVPKTIDNSPFLHIHRVNEADGAAIGGLKKAIRLAKNVKNDAEDEKAALKLPSFDIAALLYHADQAALRAGFQFELAILAETQRFFDWCWNNQTAARQLRTPDGTRAVLNSDDKMDGLRAISAELDTLAGEVAREQSSVIRNLPTPTLQVINEALRKAYIPDAA